MRTLMFYINAIHEGGAERVIIQLAYRFALAGYHSVLVTSFVDKNEYDVPDCVERISIENNQIIQSRLKRNISRIIELRKLCKKYKPEAVISFMAEPNFRSILATSGLSVKRIISVRNDPNQEYKGKLGYFLGKYILPTADGCVFQTEDARSWFPEKLQKKSAIIMNEVEQEFFDTEYVGGNQIVSIGRLCKQKNQAVLIRAFAKIADEFPENNLELYGSGDLEEDLRDLIVKLRMEKRIKLMGSTSDVPAVLKKAKVFVLSSDYEGMPNALMEALTVGVPSISTDCPCGGAKMLIHNGENGILVPVGDEYAMAQALCNVLRNSDFAGQLSRNARASSQEFHPERVFECWKKYVEGVVEEKNETTVD